MTMKNLNFVNTELAKGGYIAQYLNFVTYGYSSGNAGVGLHNKDGRCLLTDCTKEFIHLRDAGLIEPDSWSDAKQNCSGTEWRLR